MSVRISIRILAFVAFCLCAVVPPVSAADKVRFIERPDDEYLILGLEINGVQRSEGIDAYLPRDSGTDNVLVPIGSLAQALSYAIISNPGDGLAEGWFVDEKNLFQLDLLNRKVIIAAKEIPLPEDSAEAHTDDIYVRASVLEDWFGLSIELDFNNLVLVVGSSEKLPFQERISRLQRVKTLRKKSTGAEIDPEHALFLPYKWLSMPSLSFQDTFLLSKTPEERRFETTKTLQANMDFLKFGADLDLSYKTSTRAPEELTSARLTFSRQDPKKQILGPLKAGRIEVGDVTYPSVPLFAGGQRGAGVVLSSDPELGIITSDQVDTFTIEDEAPVGWDAELFRNGQFLDFQTVGPEGRFLFENLELINGYNLFKVVLYGPEGQEQTVTREVFRGPDMLEKGEISYAIAAGRPQADFLPLAKNFRKDDRTGASAEGFYGVSKFLTVGASAYTGPDGEDKKTSAGTLSAAAAFLGMNTQLTTLFADKKRKGQQLAARARPLGLNFSAVYTQFQNFLSEDQEIAKETQLSLSKNFKFLNVNLIGKQTKFLDREDERELQNIISADIFGLKLTNDLTRTFSKDPQADDFEGNISLLTDLFDFRIRGTLNYDLDKEATERLGTLRLSAQKSFEDRSSLRLNGNYEFASKVYALDARYSREFGPVSVDFNLGGSSDQNYFVGTTLRTGLQPSEDKPYSFVDPRRSALASLGVRAFVDKNGNQARDEDEDPVEDIVFFASTGGAKGKTDKNGIAWLYGLSEAPTRINVSTEEIPSIYFVPSRKKFDLIPRRGANTVIDFPFTILGEIDGFLYVEGTQDPVPNVPVRLINVQTGEEIDEMESEFDGYFVFSALPMGEYKLMASYGWFEENSPDTTDITINITPDDSVKLDTNLFLPPEEIGDIEEPEDTETKETKNL